MSSPYPTAHQIEEMFDNRKIPATFNTYFADTADIILMGKHDVLGGSFKPGQHFDDAIFNRIGDALKPETLRLEVLRVIGGGESPWAAVNSGVTATSKYDKPFNVEWVDLVRFNSEGKITQMKEFFDSEGTHNHLQEHESKSKDAK